MRRSSRQGAIPSELADLIDELDDIARRLSILEAPSGESLASTVQKLTDLVSNLQAKVDEYLASRYTNEQIDAFVAGRAPVVHTHDQADVTGAWTKAVDTASGVTAQGPVLFPDAYGFEITYTRKTAWLGDDGRLGFASSSARQKTAIQPASEEPLLALLDIEPKNFRYRAEIRRRTSERINHGRDYVPPIELGLIAEELDAAGLGAFVYHDEQGRPEGIEYGMLTVALLSIARNHERRIAALERGEE